MGVTSTSGDIKEFITRKIQWINIKIITSIIIDPGLSKGEYINIMQQLDQLQFHGLFWS